MQYLTYIASAAAESENSGLLGALGIDWRLLLVQSVSFLILVWLLGKFVYPVLVRAIDERQAAIEKSSQAAKDAQVAAEKAEETTREQLQEAKRSAADIIAAAHSEAGVIVEQAEAKAHRRADHLIVQAEARLNADVAEARESLRKEMVALVAEATEAIIGEKLDSKKDAALIERALKGRG